MKLCEDYPIYLPKGSVRAILAFLLVGTLSFMLYNKIITFEQYVAVISPITAMYFVMREKTK